MIRCAGIVHRGFEESAKLEIKEITGLDAKDIEIHEGALVFEASMEKLAELTYRTQSLKKAMILLNDYNYDNGNDKDNSDKDNSDKDNSDKDNYDDDNNDDDNNDQKNDHNSSGGITLSIEGIDFDIWLKNRTFRVNCTHTIEAESQDLAGELGAMIVKKTGAKVRLNDPDIMIHLHIAEDRIYIGIDMSGFDLSKRDYKIYAHASALNGAVAYNMLRSAGMQRDKTMLDPFCGSGIIPIEAALYQSGKSPNYFRKDKFALHKFMEINLSRFDSEDENCAGRNKKSENYANAGDFLLSCVKATRNNAKVAGVKINATKAEIDWLDTKFEEKSIDLIATNPPNPSRHNDIRKIEKVYNEFLHQCRYILRNKGRIAVILPNASLFKSCAKDFKIKNEFEIYQGQQKLSVLVLSRK